MTVPEFEELVKSKIKTVFESIITDNLILHISAKSRVGAEVSEYLQEKFVDYTTNNPFLSESRSAPPDATKNPWDAQTIFSLPTHNEIIWIDIKSIKLSPDRQTQSSPDMGSANKIYKMLEQGLVYLTYVLVYYTPVDGGLQFVTNQDGEYVKVFFLKDINSKFSRNYKNQLSVDIFLPEEKRTTTECFTLMHNKMRESFHNQKMAAEKGLAEFNNHKLISTLHMNERRESELKHRLSFIEINNDVISVNPNAVEIQEVDIITGQLRLPFE